MVKRLIIVLGIIIIIASFLFVYIYLKEKNKPTKNIYQAVPLDASVVFETKKISRLFNKLQNESEVWNELINIEGFRELNSHFSFMDSIIQSNEEIEHIINNGPIVFSMHNTGKNNVDLIFYINISNDISEKDIIKVTSEFLEAYGNIISRDYNDVKVYTLKRVKEKDLSFCVSEGIFILSYSPILLEKSIRQLGISGSIYSQYGFKRVMRTTGKNVEANLYINCNTFPKLLSVYLEKKSKKYIKDYRNFADWAELDLNIKRDVILLNGFTYSNDSTNNYLSVFSEQEPQELEAGAIIPADISAFYMIGLSNFQLYRERYRKYLDKKGKLRTYSDIKKISKELDADIEKMVYSLLEKEMGFVVTKINGVPADQNIFSIFKTKSKSISKDFLLKIINYYAEKENKSISTFVHKYGIDDETVIEIYKMPVDNFVKKLFGNIFSKAEDNYFTFVDNFLVFGKTQRALAKFAHYSILKKTISRDAYYNDYSEYFASQSNFYFYSSLTRPSEFIYTYLNDDLREHVKLNESVFRKFPAFSYQFSVNNDGLIYNNLVLKYSHEVKQTAHTIWECYLDTNIQFKPKLVTNHYTHGKEIFIQDLKNNLYLINSVGRTLWKKSIREKIMSDVYQIDFYKNGKLQLLFSTKNYIYLIDRNGNYVENYPIRLSSPATNGMALFDYEDDKGYRIFVACENKKIYAFDKKGNVVKGWGFGQTDHIVHTVIQHFRVGNKDYIVFGDKVRNYILDRRGNERVIPKLNFSKSMNNIFYLEPKTNSTSFRLVTTNKKGTIYYIYFNGEVETKFVKKYSENHYFSLKDMNADALMDYVFVDEENIDVINSKKKMIFTYNFSDKIGQPPVFYEFSATNIKIGMVNRAKGDIYLFNSDGTLYKGFPLKGKTLFSIGNLNKSMNKFNLVVGNENNLLYTYSVQ